MSDKFLTIIDRTRDLRVAAECCYDDVVGVFVQEDVWDTHVFVVYRDGGFAVAMYDSPKEDRVTPSTDSELGGAIDGSPLDERLVESLARALGLITDGNLFESDNPEFATLVKEAAGVG